MFRSAACLAFGLFLVQLPGTAIAQSPSESRMEELLQNLERKVNAADTAAVPATTRAPVDTHGVFRFIVNINFPQGVDFTGGLFCHAGVSQFSFGLSNVYSARDVPAHGVTAQHYRCVVLVPYHWNPADDASTISPGVTIYSMQVTHSLGDTNVIASEGLPPRPLPADGTTTTFNVDFDM